MGSHKKVMKLRRRISNEVRFVSSTPISQTGYDFDGDMHRFEFGCDMVFMNIHRNKRGHVRKPKPVKQPQ